MFFYSNILSSVLESEENDDSLLIPDDYWHRHRGDSNPCGQSPMDFESISLAARTQCLEASVLELPSYELQVDLCHVQGDHTTGKTTHEARWPNG